MRKYFYLLTATYFLISLLKRLGKKDKKRASTDKPTPKRTDHIWKEYDLTTKEEFRDAFVAEDMEEEWTYFEKLLRSEIRITPSKIEEVYLKIGESKIGGSPDLPDNVKWPTCDDKYLLFLAQINLEEIANLQSANELPKKGLLYFFYKDDLSINGDSLEHQKGFKVMYIKDSTHLRRRQNPTKAELKTHIDFPSCKLKFIEAWSLPDSSWPGVREQLSGDDFSRLSDFRSPPKSRTKLLGYANEIQGAMEGSLEWLLGIKSNKWAENCLEGAKNWRLLFQLDSESEAMMMFGDTGRLYFWIKEFDLKSGNLEEAWMMLQYY